MLLTSEEYGSVLEVLAAIEDGIHVSPEVAKRLIAALPKPGSRRECEHELGGKVISRGSGLPGVDDREFVVKSCTRCGHEVEVPIGAGAPQMEFWAQ